MIAAVKIFRSPVLRTTHDASLYREATDTGLVHHAVCLSPVHVLIFTTHERMVRLSSAFDLSRKGLGV